MNIINTTIGDLEIIQELFNQAIQYQHSKSSNAWHGMNRALIEQEIRENLHWKVVEEGQIACCFSIAYTDRQVWDERDADPSIYLHRIVTNPTFRGRGYVRQILAWAESFGRARGKRFIRLDTNRDNIRLNEYYQDCDMVFCGYKQFHDASDLSVPRHYLGSGLSLYEKEIK